jgi:probable HAF family extracellular repeat protein
MRGGFSDWSDHMRWLASALLAVSGPLLAATIYVAVPLGNLGGVSVYGTSINASGQIVGFADTDAAGAIHRHAFWHNGATIVNLGTLPGGTQSFAQGINDSGIVAGFSNAAGVPQLHAALFANGAWSDLGPAVGGTISNIDGINNNGDIVGATNRSGVLRAYLRTADGTFTDLGTLGGTMSQAFAVNATGSVAGSAHVASQDDHAFRYDGGIMTDLGTLGGSVSIGHAINAIGHVVGQSSTASGAFHAFFHDGAQMIDLGALPGGDSNAYGINAGDTIVGETSDAAGAGRAFAVKDGDLIDLTNVTTGLNGTVLTIAMAINDSGQIVAMSCTALLVCPQAFRLDPTGAVKMAAVEYHHAAFDHYFMTAIPDEIAKLDSGQFAGWTRTGASINVWVGDQAGTNPVCRFFSTSFDPKSSHFYTPFTDECVLRQHDFNWQFEARVFNVGVPNPADGTCAAGTQPVYRLYNNGMGAAPNHRYTTSLATRATMIAAGWIPEGFGDNSVGMCAPV